MPIINLVYEAPSIQPRTPWANTVLYLPLESDYSDLSSYNRTYTNQQWTMSFSSYWWVSASYRNRGYLLYPLSNVKFDDFTMSCWVGKSTRSNYWEVFVDLHNDSVSPIMDISPYISDWGVWGCMNTSNRNWWIDVLSNMSWTSWWHLYTITQDSSNFIISS